MRISTWALGLVSCAMAYNGFYWALLTVLVPFASELREALRP